MPGGALETDALSKNMRSNLNQANLSDAQGVAAGVRGVARGLVTRFLLPLLAPSVLIPVALIPSLLVTAGCSSGGGGGGSAANTGTPGEEEAKPDGSGTFFVDPSSGGEASRIHIAEMFWGRLVDVHDIDSATGLTDPTPVFRDWVINENTLSDGSSYELETNPITQLTRLIIQREKGKAAVNGATFTSLLLNASQNLPPILPKNDDGSDSAPFSLMTRNAALVVRVDDLLDDSDPTTVFDKVRVVTGYSPATPFSTRVLFDPNHGGIASDGQFHSSRVLIDMTVSQAEALDSPNSLSVNSLGLPASLTTSTDPNVSVRIPTKVDFGTGLFAVLENIAGGPMSTDANGPVDNNSPTLDLVRAMRAGNSADQNNGFLLDLNQPEILGNWPLTVTSAASDPSGVAGFDFVVDLQFQTICEAQPDVGDIIQLGTLFIEVTAPGTSPQGGQVPGVRARALTDGGVPSTNQLLGTGFYLSTFDPFSLVEPGCWVTFTPQAQDFPTGDVSPNVQVTARFSEPMDPASVVPFDTFLVVRGTASSPPTARSIIVAKVTPSSDLKDFVFEPDLPLSHNGSNEPYHVELIGGPDGVTDLAGNPLAAVPNFVDFTIDPNAPLESNGGIVLRFNAIDEFEPTQGFNDLRGQFFYDLSAGLIRPRPVVFRSVAADRTKPVPSIMIPFPPGIQTPLSPLGSKLQAVWRYADLGWAVDDETNFNIDVIGASWSPIGGSIVADFFQEFEMRFSHSLRLPDEALDSFLLPLHGASGLVSSPSLFSDNILLDPRNPAASQKIVHPRSIGYIVDPTTVFQGSTGTVFVPFPLNKSVTTPVTYTWRDTAITSVGGLRGGGIPMDIETQPPLSLDPRATGSIAPAGSVPSFGLPLLMEFRCFPTSTGIGLNPLDISLAVNSSAQPNFRSFSTGGFDVSGARVEKDPDLELKASGGFNPTSSPPGKVTARTADNSFYIGQLDVVTRVSRVHTVFLDAIVASPDYFTPRIEPLAAQQPLGTSVVVEYRGAVGFDPLAGDAPFDGRRIDPYGNPRDDIDNDMIDDPLQVFFLVNGDDSWKSDIDEVDGAQYLQVRISFFNNIDSGTNAELSAFGVAFEN